MSPRWKRFRCIETGCNTTVYREGERCWKCWLKLRDERIKQYQKKEEK